MPKIPSEKQPLLHKRCGLCKKRLGILPMQCRCEQCFCREHCAPEKHNCTYDYRGAWSKELTGALVKLTDDRGLDERV